MSELASARRPGPVPGATREQVLERATAHWLACRRVDVQAIAVESGVGRATIYRWFGSREGLLAAAMLPVFEARVGDARAAVGGHGAQALLETIGVIYRGLAAAPHIRAFVERERPLALTLMTSSRGPVHPRLVEIIRRLIEAEVERGDYAPPAEPATLAYVLVRLAEALLFNYADDDFARDADRLREVVAALLGASATATASSSRRGGRTAGR